MGTVQWEVGRRVPWGLRMGPGFLLQTICKKGLGNISHPTIMLCSALLADSAKFQRLK